MNKQNQESFVSEEDLFSDDPIEPTDVVDPAEPEEPAEPEVPEEPIDTGDPAEPEEPIVVPDLSDVKLSGVEQFLSSYGVIGGMIEFEDGKPVHFDSLGAEEQANVLSSLTKDSVPSVEDVYNLDNNEIQLLNEFRKSDNTDINDFLNNIVDHRLSAIMKDEKYAAIDYDGLDAEDVYIYHLKSTNPDMTDEAIADELVKAKELTTFEATTKSLRKGMKGDQQKYVDSVQGAERDEFNKEIEQQRSAIVDAVYDLNDVAGATINDEMKEYLLGDIMELNDNDDPILMEKIFSSPETMFKTNWFLNYGEDYIKNLNTYWRSEVSKARKAGYTDSINKMPGSPTIGNSAIPRQVIKHTPEMGDNASDILTEEDLFTD